MPVRGVSASSRTALCFAAADEDGGAQKGPSMKLRVYEHLCALNQNLQQALRTLEQLERCAGLRPDFLRSFRVMLEEVRCEANYELTEILSELELRDWARFGRKRRQWEKRFEDPEDIYLKVAEREKQRRKQGLPLRVGILPATVEESRPETSGRQRARR